MSNTIDSHIINMIPVAVAVINTDFTIRYANQAAIDLFGLDKNNVVGKFMTNVKWEVVNTKMQPLPIHEYPAARALKERKEVGNIEFGVKSPNANKLTWLSATATPLFNTNSELEPHNDRDSEITGIMVCFTNITQQKSQIPFEQILTNANDVVIVTEANPIRGSGPKIVYVNHAFETLFGYSKDEAIGNTPRMLQGKKTDPKTREEIYHAIKNDTPIRREIYNYSKTGHGFWIDLNIVPLMDESGEVTFFAAIERDISALKAKEKKLVERAESDPLTGILNRRGLEDRISQLTKSSSSTKKSICIAVLDIDHFKKVNDKYGHQAGDFALIEFGKMLTLALSENDIIARFGGEEFVIILPDTLAHQAEKKLNQIRETIANVPIILENNVINITVSIGYSIYTGGSWEKSFSLADGALYKAKENGRNQVIRASYH